MKQKSKKNAYDGRLANDLFDVSASRANDELVQPLGTLDLGRDHTAALKSIRLTTKASQTTKRATLRPKRQEISNLSRSPQTKSKRHSNTKKQKTGGGGVRRVGKGCACTQALRALLGAEWRGGGGLRR